MTRRQDFDQHHNNQLCAQLSCIAFNAHLEIVPAQQIYIEQFTQIKQKEKTHKIIELEYAQTGARVWFNRGINRL